ncbi:MAG: hypothetical protein BGN88_09285 [Clostridiales bacterium 43-6]|nr:MAG: hypothetical protein BGN88_09285 [Clostridiales bacterium 43-6]
MKKHHNWGGIIIVLSVLLIYALLTGFVVWGSFNKGWIVFEIVFLPLVIPITVICFKGLSRRTAAKNAFITLPEQTAETMVVNKSKKVVGSRYTTGTVFYITFEMPDGERKNFQVIHDRYATIEKDDVGTLIYKEGNGFSFFIDFKRKPNKDQ